MEVKIENNGAKNWMKLWYKKLKLIELKIEHDE